MIRQVILYFFTVFGMLEFILFFWEMLCRSTIRECTATVIKKQTDIPKLREILYILRKYPSKIYIISEKENEDYEQLKYSYPDFYVVTPEEFHQIVNGDKYEQNIRNG